MRASTHGSAAVSFRHGSTMSMDVLGTPVKLVSNSVREGGSAQQVIVL
jgi:hypothetical protein